MNNDFKKEDPAAHLLLMVLSRYFKRELGGTTEASEILARKIICIMDEE